ncbi:HepT-like ribonuclease domain-containing protein [Paraburkholderia azotifigens]|uniref:HepT-like ribonuclease domain-containing protein n=1 Tax=Paraburkholderia azotifigens TaxID=2057004 RepID=UPI0038B718AF
MPTPRERCDHILQSIQAILADINGHTEQYFLTNEPLRAACYYRLVVIGEAANDIQNSCVNEIALTVPNLAQDLSYANKLRTRLAHHYHRVDPKIVWDTIQQSLPALGNQIALLRHVLPP